jgi:hypothetical protein
MAGRPGSSDLRGAEKLDVRGAESPDQDVVCRLLVASFAQSPVARWVFPDTITRAEIYQVHARVPYEHARATGRVDVTADLTGAAIWYPHPEDTPTAPDLTVWGGLIDAVPIKLAEAVHRAGRRFVNLDTRLSLERPESAHAHLAHVGVASGVTGQGIVRRLLAASHAALDAAGIGAFVFATCDRDRHRRHGYRVAKRFTLLWGAPTLWSMWRDPIAGDGDPLGWAGRYAPRTNHRCGQGIGPQISGERGLVR